MRWGLWAIVLLGLLPLLGTGAADARHFALRFEAKAELFDDGSMRVEEDLYLYFNGRSPATVGRELLAGAGTAVIDIEAGYDGHILPPGQSPGQVELTPGNPVQVTWYMGPVFDRGRHFQLSYTILNAAQPAPDSNPALWRPLPAKRDYYIRDGTITIIYPRGWREFGQPDVLQGRGQMTRKPGQLVFETSGITLQDQAIIVRLPRVPARALKASQARDRQESHDRSAGMTDQQWLLEQQRRRSGIWTWPGVIVFFGGLYLAALTWQAHCRRPRPQPGVALMPPSQLAPALAGVLMSYSTAVTWRSALATLLDLARQGYLAVDQVGSGPAQAQRYAIRLKAEPFDPRPFEAGLIDLLLDDEHGRRRDSVNLASVGQLAQGERWDNWVTSVETELIMLGLLKPGRVDFKHRVLALAKALLALALVVTVVAAMFHNVFGRWPSYLIVPLLGQALLWRFIGKSVLVLSDEGLRQALEWQRFGLFLSERDRQRDLLLLDTDFIDYLPYAAAVNRANSWTTQFTGRGWTMWPAFFHPYDPVDGDAWTAFEEFIRVSSGLQNLYAYVYRKPDEVVYMTDGRWMRR